MARPCRQDTVNFTRVLSDEQRSILLAAGDGDLTVGFNECLSLWVAINPIKASFCGNVSRETPARASKVKSPKNAPSDSHSSSLSTSTDQ
jgi:hypothetical protein